MQQRAHDRWVNSRIKARRQQICTKKMLIVNLRGGIYAQRTQPTMIINGVREAYCIAERVSRFTVRRRHTDVQLGSEAPGGR